MLKKSVLKSYLNDGILRICSPVATSVSPQLALDDAIRLPAGVCESINHVVGNPNPSVVQL